MLGSLKNSSFVKGPNCHCNGRSKIENARNQILLRQKDAPFNGGYTSLLLLVDYGERPKK